MAWKKKKNKTTTSSDHTFLEQFQFDSNGKGPVEKLYRAFVVKSDFAQSTPAANSYVSHQAGADVDDSLSARHRHPC